MNEGFINFSRLHLNEAPVNPVAVEKQGSEAAATGGEAQRAGTNRRREAQGIQMAAKTSTSNVTEHLKDIQNQKEYLKLLEANESDWRKDLAAEDPNEPEHPYVKVMPSVRYKEIEAAKELAAAAKTSKGKTLGESTMDMSRGMDSKGFREYFAEVKAQQVEEGYKKFPRGKVQDKAAMKPDTAKGELQARRMDRARTAHTHKDTKDDAKAAVKEREQDNRKAGLEKLVKKTPTHKNKAYELEGQRRRDLDARAKRTSKGHSKDEN